MNRKREVSIILGAFKTAGLSTDDAVRNAIENGLKQVRRQKYADRHKEEIHVRTKSICTIG